MPAIVDFPQVVEAALGQFADLFANDAQRRHLGEYLTGLLVAQRKTVSGIQREFVEAADQSCLNRFLTAVAWDTQGLNERRLQILQEEPSTRYSARGVIPIDNVLIDHEGQYIQDVSVVWDHAEQRYKVAHDYLFVNYVCASGKHYPLEFRRFQSEELCACLEQPFRNHTKLCIELIDWVCARDIPGDFAMDSYFTCAEVLNHIHAQELDSGLPRAYVGSLKFNRNVVYKGQTLAVEKLAAQLGPQVRKRLARGDKTQWYFTCSLRIPAVRHKVRIVILWASREASAPRLILVTNRVQWEVKRIVGVYRHRWTGTETFHRDGKQELGLGDCQLRDAQGQTRHTYLVMVAYSLLVKQLRQGHAQGWALERLTTIGQACRAVAVDTLRTTLTWALKEATEKARAAQDILLQLGLAGPTLEPQGN